MIASAFMQDRTELALVTLPIGALTLVLGCTVDRFKKGKAGPLQFELAEEQEAREATTAIAAEAEQLALPPPAGDLPTAVAPQFPDYDPDEVARFFMADTVVQTLFMSPWPPFLGCKMQLYILDPDRQILHPVLRSIGDPSAEFRIGQGAVGTVWSRGSAAVVVGGEVSDDTYGLSPEQQQRYADLVAVAAVPVTNARDQMIAVLSVASTDPRSIPATDTDTTVEHLSFMASVAARLLVDVLKWFRDTYDEE